MMTGYLPHPEVQPVNTTSVRGNAPEFWFLGSIVRAFEPITKEKLNLPPIFERDFIGT